MYTLVARETGKPWIGALCTLASRELGIGAVGTGLPGVDRIGTLGAIWALERTLTVATSGSSEVTGAETAP